MTPVYSFFCLGIFSYLIGLYSFLVDLREGALCFNPAAARAGEPWVSSFLCKCVETLVIFVGYLFFIGLFGFFLVALSFNENSWHAILSYYYMVCFYVWVSVLAVGHPDGDSVLNALSQADAKLIRVELRPLEEQDKAILEGKTATVTTEEDDDDRRQTIDSLDGFV